MPTIFTSRSRVLAREMSMAFPKSLRFSTSLLSVKKRALKYWAKSLIFPSQVDSPVMSVPLMTWMSGVNLLCGTISFGDSNRILSPAMQSMMSFLLTNITLSARWEKTVLVNSIGWSLERIISIASGVKKSFLFAAADRISSLMTPAWESGVYWLLLLSDKRCFPGLPSRFSCCLYTPQSVSNP